MINLLNDDGASSQSRLPMTINKGQCQTLRVVGVRLDEPIFAHEQPYIVVSMTGDPQHLHIAVIKSVCRMTRNVVYKEIL